MNTVELKILAGQIVVESKLTKSSKIQLLNWLKTEASECQVKSFLLDGEIIYLDEQAEQIVDARFNNSKRIQEMESGTAKTILGIVLAGPLGWAIYRWAKGQLNSCSKKCGTFAIGSERNSCMKKCQDAVKQQVQMKAAKAKK